MRLTIAAGLALLPMAACNNNEAASNNGAGTASAQLATNTAASAPPPPAAAAPAPDLEGARVLIGEIYQPYLRGETPRTGNLYTPELAVAIARQSDGDTGLGYDPFCRCQDFENFRYTIQSVERRDNGGARAVISFTNLGESHRVTLLLDHRNDRWLVADIQEGSDSLLAGGRR
ncbi:MAG TPA: DUF3828 domain-containing protein [Allosphingosinicella sp.]|nr:DUF3828 domain-containing protein [Allosphingosinicella sp.]